MAAFQVSVEGRVRENTMLRQFLGKLELFLRALTEASTSKMI